MCVGQANLKEERIFKAEFFVMIFLTEKSYKFHFQWIFFWSKGMLRVWQYKMKKLEFQ